MYLRCLHSDVIVLYDLIIPVDVALESVAALMCYNVHIAAGSIEIGEDHIEALKREIKEETGLTIKPVKILNIYTSLYKSFKTGANYHCIQLFYICKTTTAAQAKVHFTADEKKYLKPAHWVEISKLKSLNYIGSEPIFKDIIKNFI